MTLKMGSMSSKCNPLISLSQWYIYAGLEKIHPVVQKLLCFKDFDPENEVKITKISSALKFVTSIYLCKCKKSIHWFKRYSTYKTMTLKMRSRSPKCNQLLSLPQWYISASLDKIYPLVQKIFHLQNYNLENETNVTKTKPALKVVTIYLCRMWENPSTGLTHIPLTRHWPWNEVKVTKM